MDLTNSLPSNRSTVKEEANTRLKKTTMTKTGGMESNLTAKTQTKRQSSFPFLLDEKMSQPRRRQVQARVTSLPTSAIAPLPPPLKTQKPRSS